MSVGTRDPGAVGGGHHADAGKNVPIQAKLDLQARGVCEELTLGMLAQNDVEQYLYLQFLRQDFPPELAETIHARIEGNALFLADLDRYFRESGILAQEDETWVLARNYLARDKFADLLVAEVASSLGHPSAERVEQELIDLGLIDYCREAMNQHWIIS